MRSSVLTLALILAAFAGNAQVKAVTENGEEVILNKDGTWKSLAVSSSWETRLDTQVFKKGPSSTFLVKGKRIKYGVWIDPKKWSFAPEKNESSPIEYEFSLKQEDAFAMVIPEGIEMNYESLVKIAVNNAKEAAPDAHITREETRRVNGNIIKTVEIRGTVEGIKFVYLGYYYTGVTGTIQLICYTSEPMLAKYKPEMESLLNGFIINP